MLELCSVAEEGGRWVVRRDDGTLIAECDTESDAFQLADLTSYKMAVDTDGAIALEDVMFRCEDAHAHFESETAQARRGGGAGRAGRAAPPPPLLAASTRLPGPLHPRAHL